MAVATQLTKHPPVGFQAFILNTSIESRKMVEQGTWTKTIQFGKLTNHPGPVMFYCFNLREEHEGIRRWCGIGEIESITYPKISELTEADWLPAGKNGREEAERTIFEQHFPWKMDDPLMEQLGGKEKFMPSDSQVAVVTWKFIKSYDFSALDDMPEDRRIYHPDAFSEWVRCNPCFMAGNIYMEGEMVTLMEAWARTIGLPNGLPKSAMIVP